MVLVALCLCGCDADAPIRIGFIGTTTGRGADAGISARDAALLAVEQRNAAGGVNGRKVRLIVRDDRGDPLTARQVVRAFIDDRVVAVIGPITSHIAVAVSPLTNAARMPVVSPTVATLSGKDDYFFRIAPTVKTYADKSAQFLYRARGFRRVAALFDLDNRAFTQTWVDHFTRSFSGLRGTVIAAAGFSAGAGRTIVDICREILATRVDCILIVANSMDSALLCQQIRKLDARVAIALSDWSATERLLELGGAAVEGAIVVQGFNRQSRDPRYTAFRRVYRARYHQAPSHTAVNSYDAVVVLTSAIGGRQPGHDLRRTLLDTPVFAGVQGEFRFDSFGDAVRYNTTISIVRNRQFVVAECAGRTMLTSSVQDLTRPVNR